MNWIEIWTNFKSIFVDLVRYGFPTIAIALSVLSYIDSRKAKKIQNRMNTLEEKLKNYALEDIQEAREEKTKACVEARVIEISQKKYRIKFWNSGKATAFKVDFETPSEYKNLIYKDKVPYEYLEPNKSFEEIILVHGGTPKKFEVITKWENENGDFNSKKQIVTI